MPRPALIVLEDGATFTGEMLVGDGAVGGEVVFNTSMQGYQEIVTDPSCAGQIVTFTFPMNGGHGTDAARDESARAHVRAVIARELTNYRYNHASSGSWLEWLAAQGVLAVSGVDTRALTRHLRNNGSLRGVVSVDGSEVRSLRAAARRLPAMSGLDLAGRVTSEARRELPAAGEESYHVVVYDFGVKHAILRSLAAAGMRLTMVPAATSARDVLSLVPDGVFLSNGPGDPAAVTYAVKALARLLGKLPLFGIGLGHQLLGLALGFSTYKLKFGHRGASHPVKDLGTGAIEITTQNHGFAVRDDGRGHGGATVTHVNLNDGTVEGLAAPDLHAFSVQYQPESSPGPHDSAHLFARFAAEMDRFRERT